MLRFSAADMLSTIEAVQDERGRGFSAWRCLFCPFGSISVSGRRLVVVPSMSLEGKGAKQSLATTLSFSFYNPRLPLMLLGNLSSIEFDQHCAVCFHFLQRNGETEVIEQ